MCWNHTNLAAKSFSKEKWRSILKDDAVNEWVGKNNIPRISWEFPAKHRNVRKVPFCFRQLDCWFLGVKVDGNSQQLVFPGNNISGKLGKSHDELTDLDPWSLTRSRVPSVDFRSNNGQSVNVPTPPSTYLPLPQLTGLTYPSEPPQKFSGRMNHHLMGTPLGNSHKPKDASTTLGQNDIPGWFTVCNGRWAAESDGERRVEGLGWMCNVSDPFSHIMVQWKMGPYKTIVSSLTRLFSTEPWLWEEGKNSGHFWKSFLGIQPLKNEGLEPQNCVVCNCFSFSVWGHFQVPC